MERIQTGVEAFRCKLLGEMAGMQSQERWQYLGSLGVLVEDIKKQELSRTDGNVVKSTDIFLQLRGSFFRAVDGCMLFPCKEELQAAFNDYCKCSSLSVEVGSVLIEKNFIDVRDCKSPNYLLEVEEYFFVVGSQDQAAYLLGLKHGIHVTIQKDGRSVQTYVRFENPALDVQTRAVYRQIGQRVSALKSVDEQLRQLGAVPDENGVPVLPDTFVQDEEFDLCVDQAISEASVAELTKYLCTKVKVDRRRLMERLQPLAAKRLELLMELCRINQTVYPFAFVRGFTGK